MSEQTSSTQATSATTSLAYLTLGALTDVWAGVYYLYLRNHEGSETAFLWVYGFLFTGIVLMVIGAAVGRIGRSARPAEVATLPITPTVAVSPVPVAPVVTEHENVSPPAFVVAPPSNSAPAVVSRATYVVPSH